MPALGAAGAVFAVRFGDAGGVHGAFARMPAGFCGPGTIRAGSCKTIGGQLGKVANKERTYLNKNKYI